MAAYRRIILKLSGETLASKDKAGCFDRDRVKRTADAVGRLGKMVELGVVLGGGNIWRGRFTDEMNPVNADQMGMLATIINALCLEDALKAAGVEARAFTAQPMPRFAEYYTAEAAGRFMASGGVALLAGGSGNPFFTTDTAAVLRAAELRADAVFKGTNVLGVYDSDPNKNPDAKLIERISCREAVSRGLRAMDVTAYQLCMETRVPTIRVFSMDDLENILKVANGDTMGTTLYN